MEWQVSKAKNGEATLQLNGINIYSKYRPVGDAIKWVKTELDMNASGYLLIGLGLGYHLRAVQNLTNNKPITVLCYEKEEYNLFQCYNSTKWWRKSNINIAYNIDTSAIAKDIQILLPNVWIKALGEKHKLYEILETIKIYQQSYKRFEPLMAKNFEHNTSNLVLCNYPDKNSKVACLVAAGPSLNGTISWLKEVEDKVDIYVVGSALKTVIKAGVIPKAVVISDSQDEVVKQLEGVDYTGELYYLSTANYKAVSLHKGSSFIMCQEGYKPAEKLALELNFPLLETGGSVSTITFSLLEFLEYQQLILFGLDLGFTGKQTHADYSTSSKIIEKGTKLHSLSNDGQMIKTLPNLRVYLRWFEKKCEYTSMTVYNTAKQGAKISNVPLIGKRELVKIVSQSL